MLIFESFFQQGVGFNIHQRSFSTEKRVTQGPHFSASTPPEATAKLGQLSWV
jgi:hypothetical protein